ncbi:hypothetical protein QFC19_008736 [Naganishia cerealis]|uniref:Uncharacterized protein n=1 Tax=Naganishia cerealis TaxID=610337 RepID=A0ACC2UZ88_9TREE|nr:hypothetical protein QFC19_008736 [Naganishia cerealis]
MSDTSSPLTAMSSPLTELGEPVGSPESFSLSPPLPSCISELERYDAIHAISPSPEHHSITGAQSIEPLVATEEADVEALFQDQPIPQQDDNEVIHVPDSPPRFADVIDLVNEPELVRHGNIVELRWAAGPGMEHDLVVEVDENGYEIARNTANAGTPEPRPNTETDSEEDDLIVEGQKGVRSLLDCCRGIMMRCAPRYDDIGDLQYQQHPLFFNTMSAKQLEELETNSPSIKDDTDHLWKRFVIQKSLVAYKSYDENRPPKSWRKVYKRLLREEERKMLQAAEEMKARYAAEEMEKRAKRTQITTATLNDLGYRRKPATHIGSSRGKATSLLGKVREKTVQDRKFRAPPSIQAIPRSAIESLVFPTSGPFATLGAFEPTSRPKTGVGMGPKRPDLPAPPFINPNRVIQQTISQASAAKSLAERNVIVTSTSKAMKRAATLDDSDDDDDDEEIVFLAASSKTKPSSQKTTLVQNRNKSPIDGDLPPERQQPVNMDFFSVPVAASSVPRQKMRKMETPQRNHRPIARSSNPGSSVGQRVSDKTAPVPQSGPSGSRRENQHGGTTSSWALSGSSPSGEGSQKRVQSPLFVPKRRKVY